ncbi:hypothetical protein [Sphingobacterium deserti]|uniref:Uncharacterized protein n=1 Tax=Sphingobacterium deserti TaxID=1229276 RepID=A0A0B8SZR5_9SPHI|nr:hypothetical protein [Sphingobacterium deserti]KGE13452.1 hypothetical protein DI53_2781 [Sphingobacterium deserti]
MYTIKPEQTIIDFADHQAPVSKNVLNDGFRSKRALSVIEKERLDIDFSCFKSLQKEKEEIGFVTYSPNFNMSNSSITVIYTANMKTLKKLNLTNGQLSKFIKSLDMGKLVRYDHQPKL